MTVGKNKRLGKKKGQKGKKIIDPFAKKEWYDIKAPAIFNNTRVGKTCVNPTQGTKIASDNLKGRVFELNLADLQGDEDLGYRKMKLKCEEVSGKDLLTSFHGMDFTTDKLRSLVRKWHSLIECFVDVKTTDGYILRVFCIAITKRRQKQVAKTSYAQSAQIRNIRKKMTEIILKETAGTDLKGLFQKFIPEVIGKEIEKAASAIYPLQNVYIRKVKILKAPKFDLGRLMEMHSDGKDAGKKIKRKQK